MPPLTYNGRQVAASALFRQLQRAQQLLYQPVQQLQQSQPPQQSKPQKQQQHAKNKSSYLPHALQHHVTSRQSVWIGTSCRLKVKARVSCRHTQGGGLSFKMADSRALRWLKY
jgi:hypothetical protein